MPLVDATIARIVEDDDRAVIEIWNGTSWQRDDLNQVTIADVVVAPPWTRPLPAPYDERMRRGAKRPHRDMEPTKNSKPRLVVAVPSIEGIAALYRKLTSKEPDLAYIQARLDEARSERDGSAST